MIATLSAQDLKVGGLTKIKKMLRHEKDVFIQERGHDSCVIVDLDYYNQLKMYELEMAYLSTKRDIANGDFEIIEDPEAHVKKVLAEIDKSELSQAKLMAKRSKKGSLKK